LNGKMGQHATARPWRGKAAGAPRMAASARPPGKRLPSSRADPHLTGWKGRVCSVGVVCVISWRAAWGLFWPAPIFFSEGNIMPGFGMKEPSPCHDSGMAGALVGE
uniref:Uncharacterized protein n=1 Tax=Pseudonaja textilis TaxID=8673 RepID=A0A670Z2G4_PSETE